MLQVLYTVDVWMLDTTLFSMLKSRRQVVPDSNSQLEVALITISARAFSRAPVHLSTHFPPLYTCGREARVGEESWHRWPRRKSIHLGPSNAPRRSHRQPACTPPTATPIYPPHLRPHSIRPHSIRARTCHTHRHPTPPTLPGKSALQPRHNPGRPLQARQHRP